MQEVDNSESFFAFLASEGYEYKYRSKGMQGIVVAYKKDIFKLVKEESFCFDDLLTAKQNKYVYGKGHGMLLLKVIRSPFS